MPSRSTHLPRTAHLDNLGWILVLPAGRADRTSDLDDRAARQLVLRASRWCRARAVVIEVSEGADDVVAPLRVLTATGLGDVPMLLAGPIEVVRKFEDAPVDDFLVAPYLPAEVAQRVRRIEQRRPTGDGATIRIGALEVLPASYEVRIDGQRVALTRLEFALLCHLLRHPGRVHRREELMTTVWGRDEYHSGRTIDIHVRRLRAKLGDAIAGLQTVRGVGYRFVLDEADDEAVPTKQAS